MEIVRGAEFDRDSRDHLTVALAQIEPVFLDRDRTLAKVVTTIEQAAREGAGLVAFGEAFVPGYPFWVERLDGARFENAINQEWYAHYLDQGVDVDAGDLDIVCAAAKAGRIAVYLGVMERAADRGGHTLYCSYVYISENGDIKSVHRKLQPTYEERLVWGMGDGHGLRTHKLGAFTVGGLNCWENWLPLARATLYGLGEDLHVAAWPGGEQNTEKLTPVLAMEGRSYALSVSGLMRPETVQVDLPRAEELRADPAPYFANGGSCIAAPDGSWVIPPVVGREALLVADVDHKAVRRARQSLDVAGHYSRPDVLSVSVDRRRSSTVNVRDS